MSKVLVTGGAGYVGAVLVPKLLNAGFEVNVLDLYIYGDDVLDSVAKHPGLEQIKGDLRDEDVLHRALQDCNAVVHLACISNDPSFELNPELGKSINFDAFRPLVEASSDHGVHRFIYASSSSVYGVKEEERVTEELPPEPLTDYSRYKVLCEDILWEYQSPKFTCVTLRPATVCGYSPRLRLDLTVNILTNHAIQNRRIRVFGGSQYRPNIHIDDVTDCYVQILKLPDEAVAGKTWNVGYDNFTVRDIAEQVRETLGDEQIEIATEPTDDLRSYRVDSERIRRDIGFQPRKSVRDAIRDLAAAFHAGKVPNSMSDRRYYNIKTMQAVGLK
jgi:nucleoside-diphosphate-sugar epimerase